MSCSFNKTIVMVPSKFERKNLKECVETEFGSCIGKSKERVWAGGKPGALKKALLALLMCLLSM